MATKKIKKEQAAKAPETPTQESHEADNSESEEGVSQEPSTEDGKDTVPDPGEEDEEGAGEDAEAETREDNQEKPIPKVLTALRSILYLARQYKAGDSLPVNNTEMVEAWIAAGSAEWREKKVGRFFPKAYPIAALPGQPGMSGSGTDDLAGRLPDTLERRLRERR